MFQYGLDVVWRALRVHQHPAVVLLLNTVERGEDVIVLCGRDIGHELSTSGRHQKIEIPDLGGEPLVGEVGDGFELVEIVRSGGRLHDERQPGLVEDLRAVDGVLPRASHAPELIVTIGIERIERKRESSCARFSEAPGNVFRDAHAVRTDDDPQFLLGRALDDVEDVAAKQGLAACQDRQTLRRERGDLIDDREALFGIELAAIGEVVGADFWFRTGIEIAMLAREIATVRKVPRNDVWSGKAFTAACGSARDRFGHAERMLPYAAQSVPALWAPSKRPEAPTLTIAVAFAFMLIAAFAGID